jgi:dihydrofolate synthase/folylpolyglutamate synthase
MKRGLERVRLNTGLRARREEIRFKGVSVLLDVGHNVGGITSLADSLAGSRYQNPVVLFGALRDKDVAGMVKPLGRIARHIVGVVPPTSRGLKIHGLTRVLRQQPAGFSVSASVRNGLLRALRLATGRRTLVVTGSHFLVGEVITLLENKLKPGRSPA